MIRSVRVLTVVAPLAVAFDHAGHARTHTSSVLVEVTLESGHRGWGEGAPRPYVTGEARDTVVRALGAVEPEKFAGAMDWRSLDTIVGSLAAVDLPAMLGRGRPAPAAAAAWETAVLDAVCRAGGHRMSDAVRAAAALYGLRWREPEATPVALVIDLSRDVAATLERMPARSRAALRHVKVKVGADLDGARLRVEQAVARVGTDTSVSLDVNGAWDADQACRAAPGLAGLGLAWIEEPTRPRDWAGLARLRREGVPVMLDESCVNEEDLDRSVEAEAATHINVRVSKCGGVLPSVRLAARAQELGVERQLGVQVAEVGPLWATGRALSTCLPGWRAVEAGRGDEWFPDPLTSPAFAVDRERHLAEPLDGPGTGVVPSPALLHVARPCLEWRPGGRRWRATS